MEPFHRAGLESLHLDDVEARGLNQRQPAPGDMLARHSGGDLLDQPLPGAERGPRTPHMVEQEQPPAWHQLAQPLAARR
ncbi:MAG: hypothetical protein ACRCSN_20980 [Dermatophilaceae bacterium]